jgi:predicted transcriptional regulator
MIGRADVPFVAAFREDPTGVELDVYIVPIAPRPVHVRERMLPIAHTYHKDAAYESLDQVTLAWLIKDMEGREVTRLPVLKNRSPMCVVHKATINEFLARRALDTGDVRNLTLADLLEHQSGSLRDSFVEMAPDATMEEALEAMNANDACQDVYITDRGAVIGWLTNVMFIE